MRSPAWIAAAAALLLLPGLGRLDLWAPDEPRYAEVAEELRALPRGPRDLVLLRLGGAVYTQKPPLYFWLAALSGAPLGRVTEAAARLPSALAGVATVALVAGLGSRLLGAGTGLLGGALLLTCWEFLWRARRAQLDVLLTFFEVAALSAFWRCVSGGHRQRRDLALLHGSLGLAVLTKGPVGWLLPVLAMVAFLAWEGRGSTQGGRQSRPARSVHSQSVPEAGHRAQSAEPGAEASPQRARGLAQLAALAPPWALALSLGPALVWLAAAAALAPEGFLDAAVGRNVFARFAAGHSHLRPVYYYLYQLPLSFLPWSLLAPWVLATGRRVLGAGADPVRARGWRFLLAWLGTAFVFFSISAEKRGLYLLPALPAAALLSADSLRPWLAARLARPARAVALLVGSVALVQLAVLHVLLPRLEPEKSARPLAEAAAALTPPGRPVGLLAKGTLVSALLYYGGRPVEPLDSPAQAAAFLAAGGEAVVARARDLPELRRLAPLEVRATARSGARTLHVVARAQASPQGDRGPASPGG